MFDCYWVYMGNSMLVGFVWVFGFDLWLKKLMWEGMLYVMLVDLLW